MSADTVLTYRIAMASLRGLTPKLTDAIVGCVGSEERFFTLTSAQIAASAGFNNRLFDASVRRRALEEARREEKFVADNNVKAIYYTDPGYPERLSHCDDAPLMIYTLGDCDLNHTRFVSIVGTRHATAYGVGFVDDLVGDLASLLPEPPVIVSGLAYGIDIAAHEAALRHGLPTVGVLAHGLNTIYPASHRSTAVRMVRSGGMLLTDYRSLDATHKGNFLARNRIVAGMCDCLVVAESDLKGGALVTARLASAYSRDVFALPGRTADRYSRGCNRLIADCTASLITSAEDLVQAMGWPAGKREGDQQELFAIADPEEQTVADAIASRGDATVGELAAVVDIPVARLMGMLIDMEFRSILLSLPGGRYRLRHLQG